MCVSISGDVSQDAFASGMTADVMDEIAIDAGESGFYLINLFASCVIFMKQNLGIWDNMKAQ